MRFEANLEGGAVVPVVQLKEKRYALNGTRVNSAETGTEANGCWGIPPFGKTVCKACVPAGTDLRTGDFIRRAMASRAAGAHSAISKAHWFHSPLPASLV